MNKKNSIYLILSILIAIGFGGIGALLGGSMSLFDNLLKPSFAPPAMLFPIVWVILYILMGISAFYIYQSDSKYKKTSLMLYFIQLVFNAIWSMIFFRFQNFLFAFVWLLILLALVILMQIYFYKTNKLAFYLQIPYVLWLVFALILNYSVYMLN